MNAALTFSKSSIGKKWIVALTGLAMFLFVIGHLAGNLQFFIGPEAINHYGELLRIWPELLWVIRIGLLTCLVLHVIFTTMVVIENRKARPQKYVCKNSVQSKMSTKLMALTGIFLLAFIIFHLAHFTTQSVRPEFSGFHDEKGRHDVFRMVVIGFSDPVASGVYIVAMILLCSHLSHGAWSWLQTLGLRTKKVSEGSNRGAAILATILAVGYISLPASVLLGKYGTGYVAERERAEQAVKQITPSGTNVTPATGSVSTIKPEAK